MNPAILSFQSTHPAERPEPKKAARRTVLKIAGWAFAALFSFQALPEKASAALPLPLPTPIANPLLTQPNAAVDSTIQPSLSSQLLNLLAQGSFGIQGSASSEMIFAITAPLSYNTNPGLSSGSSSPAWDFDPELELLHAGPLADDLLLTEIIGADAALYPDHSGYNLNTLSGQLQMNFTDQGLHFESAPFIAYKTGLTVPADFSGHAWVNDFELGYNFNRVFGTGGKDPADPLEVDFNPGISQRWIQVGDGGYSSSTGSTAFEMEIPFIYRFTSRLDLLFDFTTYTRYYNVNQAPANRDRVDEAFSLPLSIGWTMVPDLNLKLEATGGYTQQFSSVSGQEITQLSTGVNLQAAF